MTEDSLALTARMRNWGQRDSSGIVAVVEGRDLEGRLQGFIWISAVADVVIAPGAAAILRVQWPDAGLVARAGATT